MLGGSKLKIKRLEWGQHSSTKEPQFTSKAETAIVLQLSSPVNSLRNSIKNGDLYRHRAVNYVSYLS